ncbi:pyridoxal kinase PdxY [Raineyella sp. W15-4]|uniref:pyridoxal kinase PdxY n=1 Tax=Raineyella sp. W15-4 TaxID=3081651 RepID=UPI00295527F3|nr:pyridoxal kinase PdxY [Raineyella sp. W15-4]WOQ18663.1 pyridoxal kinase PdxY [Raineyella sp. W15-4]
MTSILSIQSSVAYGHAGNSAAAFPLMRMGIEVYPVLTVHFSNHTGYGAWRGPLLDPADVLDVVRGIDERGALAGCDALLSGYLGNGATGATVLAAAELLRERNPDAVWCCDPVMGDVGRGFFVRDDVPPMFRDRVVPMAQVLTPNHFELDHLVGRETHTLDEILAAVDELRSRGPRTVLVTSMVSTETDPSTVQLLAVDDAGAYLVTTPKLDAYFVGSGDVTSAIFLAHLLGTGSARSAVENTAAAMFGLLHRTRELGRAELALVDAQDEFVAPAWTFTADRLR